MVFKLKFRRVCEESKVGLDRLFFFGFFFSG